jgi:hypothetical protein
MLDSFAYVDLKYSSRHSHVVGGGVFNRIRQYLYSILDCTL